MVHNGKVPKFQHCRVHGCHKCAQIYSKKSVQFITVCENITVAFKQKLFRTFNDGHISFFFLWLTFQHSLAVEFESERISTILRAQAVFEVCILLLKHALYSIIIPGWLFPKLSALSYIPKQSADLTYRIQSTCTSLCNNSSHDIPIEYMNMHRFGTFRESHAVMHTPLCGNNSVSIWSELLM